MLFRRPFKIRSNVNLRESARRKLVEHISVTFALSPEDAHSIFNDKVVSEMKLNTFSRLDVMCYLFDSVPFVFKYESQLFPTVFLLSLLYRSNVTRVYTYESVMDRIFGGADLKLPGVIRNGTFGEPLSSLQKSSICAIAAISGTELEFSCSKPLAIGVCDMNHAEVKASGGKGNFVSILHTARDKLVELCPSHLLPSFKIFEKSRVDVESKDVLNTDEASHFENQDIEDAVSSISSDELLLSCFAYALTTLNPTELPIPLSTFYSKYMKTDCPNGSKLDIKKTSYKKVGIFLEKMAAYGIISLTTVNVGITQLVNVNKDHPKLMELVQSLPEVPTSEEDLGNQNPTAIQSKFTVGDFYFGPPVLDEVRIITSQVAPFFAAAGYSPGSAISQAEICHLTRSYIVSNGLCSTNDRNIIEVNALLARVCDPMLFQETPASSLGNPCFQITFQNLITSLTRGLKRSFRLVFPDGSGLQPLVTQGNSPPKLKLDEAKRNGKDVTRITSLGVFGIDPKHFARYVQSKLACSATTTEDSSNAIVVQAQGSHRVALSKILIETFGLSKNWIDGFAEEKKPKKKNSRR